MAVRVRLHGNTDIAKSLLPAGKKFLQYLIKDMKFNDLKQNQRTINMADGVVFKVQRVFSQDTIDVTVPVEEIIEKGIEKEVLIYPDYKIKLTRIITEEILTTACLTRLAFYHRDATDLEDMSKVLFDYKVPDDKDENGKLITSPEEYFGSKDNPGLEWDDNNECFVINIRNFSGVPGTLDYATALGAGELKHFMVYSCMDCELTKYREARQDQQYPEITDDDERWKVEDLVEPSFGAGNDVIFEDEIICTIGICIMARVGNWRVIWDAVTKGYAKGVINDNGDEIMAGDWPVHYSILDDWITATVFKSQFGFSWGSICTEQTITDCPDYGGNDVDCEIADYYVTDCMQRYVHTYEYDGAPPFPGYEYKYTYRLLCTAGYATWVPCCRSYYGELNGFDVFFRWLAETEMSDDEYASDVDNGYRTYHEEQYVTFITPWGNMFENLLWVYSDLGLTKSEGSSNCTGEQVYWWHKMEGGCHERIGNTLYQHDNIIFGLVGGFYHKVQCDIAADCFTTDCYTVLDEEWGIDARGTINFYTEEKCLTIDPNNMGSSEDIREGFLNLLQGYFDDVNAGEPQLYSLTFQHREGVV